MQEAGATAEIGYTTANVFTAGFSELDSCCLEPFGQRSKASTKKTPPSLAGTQGIDPTWHPLGGRRDENSASASCQRLSV